MLHAHNKDDNLELFMWMLHNEMIMEKCLCECCIQWNDNGEMIM
jgi:hypothetical protein